MTARYFSARRSSLLASTSKLRAAFVVACCSFSLASVAHASPGITKKGDPTPPPQTSTPAPSQSSSSRDAALSKLRDGERLLQAEKVGDALVKMLEAYMELEKIDGAEAKGVKELRSWLVKALETAELKDEAKQLRSRGSYVDHPLSVMPSTWFAASSPSSGATMTLAQATDAVERGLDMLKNGDVDGLGLLLEAYEVVEKESGAESEDAQSLRNFMVGFLETGGFVDEAKGLRNRGSVKEPTDDEKQVYVLLWAKILEQAENGGVSSGTVDGSGLKGGWDQGSSSSSSSSSDDSSGNQWDGSSSDSSSSSSSDDDDDDDDKPRAFRKGSPVPSVMIDFGLGNWKPEQGENGFIWTTGLTADWTMFSVKFFSMKFGLGGLIGRNRDKRWMHDVYGRLGLSLNFGKFYMTPEFGGGYDGVTGEAGRTTTVTIVDPVTMMEVETTINPLRIDDNPYYHFGGELGINFGENYGLYGRAVRVNRITDDSDPLDFVTNETRVRAGFTVGADAAEFDLALVLGFYTGDLPDNAGDASHISGNVGIRF